MTDIQAVCEFHFLKCHEVFLNNEKSNKDASKTFFILLVKNKQNVALQHFCHNPKKK